MTFTITTIIAIIAALTVPALATKKLAPEWVTDLPRREKGYNLSLLAGGVLGVLTAIVLTNAPFENITPYDYRVLPIVLMVTITPMVFLTDFAVMKIPRKVSEFTLAIIALNTIPTLIMEPSLWVRALAFFAVPILLFLFVGGIGMADILLIAMFALGMSWVNVNGWVWSLIGSSVFSLVVAGVILLVKKRLTKVEMEPTVFTPQPAVNPLLEKKEEEDSALTSTVGDKIESDATLIPTAVYFDGMEPLNPTPVKETPTMEDTPVATPVEEPAEVAAEEPPLHEATDTPTPTVAKKVEGKKKYAVPAGPGFILSFIAVSVILMYTFGADIPATFLTTIAPQ